MATQITLQQATPANLPEMKELYRGTIMEVCSGEYNEAQRQVWAASSEKTERWDDMIHNQYVLLAMTDAGIAGFASLDKGNYIDFLYVHKDFQRMGIAETLLTAIEAEAARCGTTEITSDISKTARPFFEKKGYRVVREQVNRRADVVLVNYKMGKRF